jgi:hypothetical protein
MLMCLAEKQHRHRQAASDACPGFVPDNQLINPSTGLFSEALFEWALRI